VFREPQNDLGPVVIFHAPDTRVGNAVDNPIDDRAEVTSWDGQRVCLRVSVSGRYGIACPDDGRQSSVVNASLPKPIGVEGSWDVRFDDGLSAPQSTTFDRLISWTDHANLQIKYFSGNARYRRSFDLPGDWLAEGRRMRLDLGKLWAVGEVFVNGRSAGVLWKPPRGNE
jgi:hypothetical protein